MIILAVTLQIKPEHREEATKIALTMTKETHKEPGVVAYTFHSPLDNPNIFFVYEEWKDQDALDFHNNSPHMKIFADSIGPLLNGDTKVDKYTV